MKKIFKFIVFYPKQILSIVLALTVILGYFSTKLAVDASTETLLLEDDKDLALFRDVAKRYASPNYLVVAYTPKNDLLDDKTIEKIRLLSDEFAKNELVDSIVSILNVPLLQSSAKSLSDIIDKIPALNDKDINKTAAREEFASSPLYSNSLVSSDLKTTAIILNLKSDEQYNSILNSRNLLLNKELNGTISSDEKKQLRLISSEFKAYRDQLRVVEQRSVEQVREAIKKFKDDEKLFLGGVNMIASDMVSYVKSDLYIYGISVTLLLIFSLWLFFRQFRWIVLPIFICIISVIFATGIFGFLGWEITVISSNFVALQLIITISVVIHLIVSYREFCLTKPKLNQRQLVYITLRDKINPSFFAIFTTVIGFLSLAFSDIKPVIMLGIMMSSSISVSFVLAFLIFGSVVSNLKKLQPIRTFEDKFSFTKICANFAINYKFAVYGISALMLAFGIYGISKLKVENSFIEYFKSSTEIFKGMQVIDTKLGGTVPVDVLITFKKDDQTCAPSEIKDEFEAEFEASANDAKYWFNSYKMGVVKKVHEYLENKEFVGKVSSLGTLLDVIEILNKGEADDFLLSVMYEQMPQTYKNIILSPFVSIEDNQVRFSLRTIDSDKNLRRDEFLKELKNDLLKITENDNVKVEISGAMVLYNNMLQSLIFSQIDSFGFVFLTLFIVFCIIFRSIKLALISIVANIIPLCIVFGVMGVAQIPLDIMSITIASISIGIGVDDMIHYIHRFKIENRIKSVKESIKASHASIGYAMYYTSFAIFLGFSVMVTSNFIPTIYFGVLTDLVMAMMLLGALILLPALIHSFYGEKLIKHS
ncbi:efflux RND transporter permease subunit [Campylobacter sp. RM16192]|uniref:efflux RND transporter permease subunit n=1 Tax=Campylobacter sp. RM16192 TaxID=1660080 RepID=UPI0014511982|nr:MMPL family transporter [Campylobacter sp. RM16192]QCD51905.1 RND superfamily exporter [Campylobacter sp. RM16192]